jgi:hypothetical protein
MSARDAALADINARIVARRPTEPLKYVTASKLDLDAKPPDELVEGLLGVNALSVLYGESNTGKTFLAADLACAIARGHPWLGRKVTQGMVVYLATEGAGSVQERLRAYQRHHGELVQHLHVVTVPVNLFDGQRGADSVITTVAEISKSTGKKCVLIIGDTLARLAAGANENSSDDMTTFLESIDLIRAETGAAMLLIHHSGKDASKGMRGWSGLKAAVDTELLVHQAADGAGWLKVTKQRDMSGKGDRIGFRLLPVPMSADQWGNPRSSCVVVGVTAFTEGPTSKVRWGKHQIAILRLLRLSPDGMTRADLISQLGFKPGKDTAGHNAITKLLADGDLVERAGVIQLSSVASPAVISSHELART